MFAVYLLFPGPLQMPESGAALITFYGTFLSDPGIPGPIYGSEPLKLTPRPFADLTDVTLADEDTNSIRTDNANKTQGNKAMQVTQPGRKICNYASCAVCKYANGAI